MYKRILYNFSPCQLSVDDVFSDVSDTEGDCGSDVALLNHSRAHNQGDQAPPKKKKKTQRTAEDDTPLPNPFPLPKHYGSDVEAALQAKKFCKTTRTGFISKVASAMLCYKNMPMREDYINVSQAVIAKYSFLKSTEGTAEVLY